MKWDSRIVSYKSTNRYDFTQALKSELEKVSIEGWKVHTIIPDPTSLGNHPGVLIVIYQETEES